MIETRRSSKATLTLNKLLTPVRGMYLSMYICVCLYYLYLFVFVCVRVSVCVKMLFDLLDMQILFRLPIYF